MQLCLGQGSQYLAQALQQYGVTAELLAAQTANLHAISREEKRLLRQMEIMGGVPPGTLGV